MKLIGLIFFFVAYMHACMVYAILYGTREDDSRGNIQKDGSHHMNLDTKT